MLCLIDAGGFMLRLDGRCCAWRTDAWRTDAGGFDVENKDANRC